MTDEVGPAGAIAPTAHPLISLAVLRPRFTVAVFAILALAVAPGILFLQVETATESILNRYSDTWNEYQKYVGEFGSDEYISLLIEAEAPFSNQALTRVASLTHEFATHPGIERVDSLASVPSLLLNDDGHLVVRPLLSGSRDAGVRDYRAWLDRHRSAKGWLVSDEGRSFGVHLVLRQPVEENYGEVLQAISSGSARDLSSAGVPIFRAAADETMRRDLMLYVPATLALVVALALVLLGSWSAVICMLSAAGFSTWFTLCVMGMIGVPLSITTVVLPPVILALGCSYAMHVLCAISSKEPHVQVREISRVANPLLLSGMTTAIGFLGIAVIRIDAINRLGLFGALSVTVLILSTLVLVPALMLVLKLDPAAMRSGGVVVSKVQELWLLVGRRKRFVLAGWVAAIGVAGGGLLVVEVSTNVIEWFPEHHRARLNYEKVKAALSGISPVAVVLRSRDRSVRVSDAEVVRRVQELSAHLRTIQGVGHVLAFSDVIDQLRSEIRGSGVFGVLSTEEVQQLLLLVDDRAPLGALLAPDQMATAVALRVDDNGSEQLRRIGNDAVGWWERSGPEGVEASATGVMLEFARSEDEIVHGQVRGFAIALMLIAMLFAVVFRSWKLVVIGVCVNLLPLALSISTLGYLGLPLDAAKSVIACLALGIAVDDSIHLIYQWRSGILGGLANDLAAMRSLELVARPVVYSSCCLLAGFAALGLSSFSPVSGLGGVTALAIGFCLFADLTLLPAAIVSGGGSCGVEGPQD